MRIGFTGDHHLLWKDGSHHHRLRHRRNLRHPWNHHRSGAFHLRCASLGSGVGQVVPCGPARWSRVLAVERDARSLEKRSWKNSDVTSANWGGTGVGRPLCSCRLRYHHRSEMDDAGSPRRCRNSRCHSNRRPHIRTNRNHSRSSSHRRGCNNHRRKDCSNRHKGCSTHPPCRIHPRNHSRSSCLTSNHRGCPRHRNRSYSCCPSKGCRNCHHRDQASRNPCPCRSSAPMSSRPCRM